MGREQRQMYLLLAFADRYAEGIRNTGQPFGFVPTHRLPSCIRISKDLTICDPGGIGMANVRGLIRKGLVEETAPNFFYISDTGRIAAEIMIKRLLDRSASAEDSK
jgi:hypothetical protein